jgi:hypothetical protein
VDVRNLSRPTLQKRGEIFSPFVYPVIAFQIPSGFHPAGKK